MRTLTGVAQKCTDTVDEVGINDVLELTSALFVGNAEHVVNESFGYTMRSD